ncbi:MAG: M81 family metallopeptidase [Thermomicrobiales bacterium]|nr:M81 family metallopeptidase [Thermomicrobiales bacterium]
MRIAVGRFWTETSSMTPLLGKRAMFEAGALVEGTALLDFFRGTRTEVGGFLAALDEAGIEPAPLLGAHASCSGPVEQPLWEWIYDRMTTLLREQLPVDGVLISLHGASLAVGEEDTCGALLAGIREIVGPDVPIAATLDMHGNPTERMARSADALVAYKTYPHHDFVDRGLQAARIVIDAANGLIRPVTTITTIPMYLTSLPLMEDLIAAGVEREREPGVLCCSIMPTHPHLDVEEFHVLSAVTVTDGEPDLAQSIGRDQMWRAWSERDRIAAETRPRTPLPKAITDALAMPPGTVVIADPLDSVTGGFPGDCTAVIESLLDLGVTAPSLHIINDPGFVERAEAVGIGGTLRSPLGGTWGADRYEPVTVDATIRLLSDGKLMKSREPQPGHLEVSNSSMGRTAVVEIEPSITVVVTSVPVMSTEQTVFRSVGIEPYEYRIVVVKSVNQQRFHYTEAAGFIDLAGPGWGNAGNDSSWRSYPRPRQYPTDDVTDEEILAILDRQSEAAR